VADEKSADEQAKKAPVKEKKSPLKFILMGVVVLVLVLGGVVGWTLFSGETDEAAKETVVDENAVGKIYSLKTFVVNLNDPGGKRYIKTKIELEYIDEAVNMEIDARLPQIRDAVLLLLSSKSLDEIQDVDGKIDLRNELILRINQVLKQGKIRNLYFTELVIQ
jgi:flagellar FliL protein